MSMLEVNDLANYVMQQNLRGNDPSTDAVGPNQQPMSQPSTSEAGGPLGRRLPPQHPTKLRL